MLHIAKRHIVFFRKCPFFLFLCMDSYDWHRFGSFFWWKKRNKNMKTIQSFVNCLKIIFQSDIEMVSNYYYLPSHCAQYNITKLYSFLAFRLLGITILIKNQWKAKLLSQFLCYIFASLRFGWNHFFFNCGMPHLTVGRTENSATNSLTHALYTEMFVVFVLLWFSKHSQKCVFNFLLKPFYPFF